MNYLHPGFQEVFFMLPPLLSLLLDCAKKTDQSVVSIALGALVHLVEAGGHQFSDNDWDTLLKSIRDASFTTQPLELLHELGFQHSNTPKSLGDMKPDVGGGGHLDSLGHESANSRQFDGSEDLITHHVDQGDSADLRQNSEMSEGLPSPSQKPSNSGELQRNQSLGQRIMGNVFLRSFTSKAKYELDIPVQSQTQALEAMEFDSKEEVETPLLTVVRGKCVTQLLLLGAIDSIQKKYWLKLNAPQKVAMMEILLSILDFASSYNSYNNLRLRMQQLPADRPPSNLLRQELAGACIYLDVLQRTTSELGIIKENNVELNDSPDTNTTPTNNHLSTVAYSKEEEQLEQVAEEKLVSFCGHVLKEASEFQLTAGGTNNKEIHRVLELRSPIIVKVIKGMAAMNSQIFKKHLRVFYPLLAKLVCCDQMDVRRALGELFKSQFSFLLP
ncbi:hypothetical protein KSS87_009647 [Heliosperma pusillum]|nr:hypothetical protein KSS87_009647 [Heliosperma pusillum]